MVVQIDCNALDPRAKNEMLTKTREQAKETQIRDDDSRWNRSWRLGFDKKLAELNTNTGGR